MNLLEIIVRTPDGDVPCKGLPTPVPGLFVVDDATALGTSYGVVHSSGVGAGLDFPDPESALAAAVAIGPLLDWSQDAFRVHAALNDDRELADRVDAIVRQHGGTCTGPNWVTAADCARWSTP